MIGLFFSSIFEETPCEMEKDGLIDNQFENVKVDLTYNNGANFSIATRVFGFLLIVLGFAALLTGGGGFIIGPFILVAAVFALTSYSGTDISLEHNLIREYNKAFGFKFGKWKSTSIYPFVGVIGNNKNQYYTDFMSGAMSVTVGPVMNQNNKIESNSIEIVLLSSTHLKRIMVVKCKRLSDAIEKAKEISEKMNKELVKFNPQISESSKRKR